MHFRSFPILPLTCLLILTAAAAGCGQGNEETVPPPQLRVDFLPELQLGGDPDASPETLLGHPRFIRTDRQGNIYIADAAAMMIRVFDASGTFVRTIGSRGRATGQFLDITCMHIDREDELIIADGLRQTITRFSTSGEVLATAPIETDKMMWPRDLRDPVPGQYLFLYKMPQSKPKSIFHLFDRNFQKLDSFGKWTRMMPGGDGLNDQLVQIRPGSFLAKKDGTVLYAPWAYRGEIYGFADKDGEWERTTTLTGHVVRESAFTAVDPDQYGPDELSARIKTRVGQWGVIFHNESRGLFELEDGRLVHFTTIEAHGQRIFGAELYTAAGQLIGYAPYESKPLRERGATFVPLAVDWKDADDRFYIRRLAEKIPAIRVVRIQFGDADTPAQEKERQDLADRRHDQPFATSNPLKGESS
ncbi:MAG: 6-bladed beta-propeller [bacterium]|nr:6-bladed beta-propeller [bacterium]